MAARKTKSRFMGDPGLSKRGITPEAGSRLRTSGTTGRRSSLTRLPSEAPYQGNLSRESSLIPSGPGRSIPIEVGRQSEMDQRMAQVIRARRGIENRGTVPASGSRMLPKPVMGPGLETRGVVPSRGSRVLPKPMYGPGREEMMRANIGANRAGNSASRFRNSQGFVGEYGPTRADMIRNNVRISREARTGGFRRSGLSSARTVSTGRDIADGAMHGPGRTELGEILKNTSKTNMKEPLLNTFKSNKGLLVGAGIAVGAYALMNRRGKGTSSGRTSTSRY